MSRRGPLQWLAALLAGRRDGTTTPSAQESSSSAPPSSSQQGKRTDREAAEEEIAARVAATWGSTAAALLGELRGQGWIDFCGEGRVVWLETAQPAPGATFYTAHLHHGGRWIQLDLDLDGWRTLMVLSPIDLSREDDRRAAAAALGRFGGWIIPDVEKARGLTEPPTHGEARWQRPPVAADPAFLDEFRPPTLTDRAWTFFANARVSRDEAPSIVRCVVDVRTRAVTATRLCGGYRGGVERMQAGGRAWVADDGAFIVAAAAADDGGSSAVARAWRAAAAFEHASVASFARSTLELLALGAPLDLVERTQAAALDEVRHARLSLALARRSARGGPTSGHALAIDDDLDAAFGPLPALPTRAASHARLAVDTLVEAAVPETLAARSAAEAARRCRDAVVARVLAQIADDEERHAALAWDIIAWAVRQSHGARAAVAAAAATVPVPVSPSLVDRDDDGLLSAETETRVWQSAFDERVRPRLHALPCDGAPEPPSSTKGG